MKKLSFTLTAIFCMLKIVNAQYFWNGPTTSGTGITPAGGAGTWSAAGTNWTTANPGNATAWSATKTANFIGTGANVILGANQSATGITFGVSGYNIMPGAGPYGLTITGATANITLGATLTNTISAPITTGSGTALTIIGTSSPVFTSGGNNSFGSTVALSSTAGSTNFTFSGNNTFTGLASIINTGGGTFNFSGTNTFPSGLTVSQTGGPKVNFTGSNTFGGPITISSTGSPTITFSGAGSNSFTGLTSVNAASGTPAINYNAAASSFTGGLTISEKSAIGVGAINGMGPSGSAGTITVTSTASGTTLSNSGSLSNLNIVVYNPVVLNSGGTYTTNSYQVAMGGTAGTNVTINWAGNISGGSDVFFGNAIGTGSAGQGVAILSGNNSWVGETVYNGKQTSGVLQCQSTTCFPPHTQFVYGNVTAPVANGYGIVDLDGQNGVTIGSLESNIINAGLSFNWGFTNSSGSKATLIIQGGGTSNANATFACTIGIGTTGNGTTLTSTNNNIAITMQGSAGTETFTGVNGFTGGLNLNAGTLVTGVTNALAATLPVSFNGGTLNTGGSNYTQGTSGAPLGTIIVGASGGTIALGSGNSIYFANSNSNLNGAYAWAGTLTVTGWTGSNHIYVGSDNTGLYSTQLSGITYSGGAYNGQHAQILSNGEVVPTGAAVVALGVISPAVGTESPSTTFTVTANALGFTPTSGSTVTFSITGIQSNQVVGGVLTGTITFNGSSTSATGTFQTTTGTTFVGQETGSVTLTSYTGSITTISTTPATFTLDDNATFYWNGAAGLASTAVAGPGLGGTGTWTTYTTPTNSWIIGQGASTTGNPGNWIDALYPAYLGGSQGTVSLDGINMTTPALNPTTTTVATNNDVITPNNATAFSLGGNLVVGTTGSPVNVTLNDPSATTAGTAAAAARTLILTGGSISGVSGSTITVGGQQGSSTSVYSWLELQPSVTGGSYTTNIPIIMDGTGGGYVDVSYNGGVPGTYTLNGNGTNGAVQIANGNNAGVVLGSTASFTLAVNGITASPTNFSSVIISNKPAGTGSGNFIFEGTSNYYGPTTLAAAGIVKCAAGSVISPNSVYTFGPSGQGPTFDLDGTNQTIAGLASVTGATGSITNSTASGNSALTINQGSGVTNTFGLPILNGTGSTVSLELSGVDNTSSLKLTSTSNTFTGGLKIDANGNLIVGAANVLASGLSVTLNGGTLTTSGATPSNSVNALTVSGSTSAITLEATAHTLTFASMSGISNSTPLTINGWNGTPGASGTASATTGKIIVSGTVSGTELNNINFTGFGSGAVQVSGTNEIVPAQALLTATIDSISPTTGSEAAGTTYTITVSTTLSSVPTAVINSSTVTYTLTGIQATQVVGGSLTGTITIPAGSSTGTATFTVQNDNIFEGTETGTVAISNPTGNIGLAAAATVTFTLVDDINTSLFYWNGGTPTNNPATGGTGTWTAANAWIAPVNDGTGVHATWQPGNYNAYLVGPAANAGVITFQTSPNPTNTYVQATGYSFTTSTSPNNTEVLGGTINLPAGYNLNIFTPTTTTTKELDIMGLSSGAGSTLTVNQGAAVTVKTDLLDFDLANSTISANINIVSLVTQLGGGAGSVVGIVGNAPGVIVSGSVTNTSSQYAYTVLGATSGNSMTISGQITSTAPITFSNGTTGGNGVLTLTNPSNSFTTAYFNGTATNGLVQAGLAGSIPTTAAFVMGATSGSGQSFDLNGNDVTIASLSSNAGGTGTITNTAVGTGTNTLTVNQSVSTTFGLVITDGSTRHTGFTLQGSGSLTLTNSNTYTGATTVSGGTLFVNNAAGLAAGSTVTVQGGILAGNGAAAGSVNVNSGGIIAPGATAGTVGIFTTGDENWTNGSALNFDITNVTGGPTAQAGTNWDLLASTGTIDLTAVGASGITIYINGTPSGFSATSTFSWQFATATSISGFSAGKFAFNVSSFNGGAQQASNFSVTQSGSSLIINYTPTVNTPTPITISAGTEPICPLTNATTTTTYATAATYSTGFNWSLSNNAAGSIDPVTGVMTWANGFSGTVYIQVTANGPGGPSAQVTRLVTVGPAPTTPVINVTDPLCNGGDGTINVTTPSTGGTGNPISYSLNGGTPQTSTTFGNVPPPTVCTVVATDVNGCPSATSNSVTVVQPTAITTPVITKTNALCNGETGSVTVTTPSTGGTGTILYSLNGGTPQTSTTFSGITANTVCTVVASDDNSCTSSTSNSVTVTQPTVLTISANSGTPFAEGQTINLTSITGGGTPGAGYSYSWSGPISFTSNIADPDRGNASPGMSGAYDVTVTDANLCTATATTTVLVSSAGINIWIGTTTDWFTASNWTADAVPASCGDTIIIPSGRPNYPVLTANAAAGAVTLQNGVNINQQTYSLSICGPITGPTGVGTSVSILGTGVTILNGTALQTITGIISIPELALNNTSGASFTSGAKVSIGNALDLQTGNLNVSNGTLTLLSTSVTQVAIIDNFSGGNNGTLTGNINSERYYASSSTYLQHFMGSPVNNPALSQFGAVAYGNGGYVVPQADCDEANMAAGSPYGQVFSYHENAPRAATCGLAEWFVERTGNATNGQGYSVLKLGSGTITLTGGANLSPSYTLGSLSNSNWANTSLQGRAMSSGWQLVSNPYQATLQINTTNAGFDNQIQVWNANGPNAGTYQPGTIGSDAIVAPFQAFMVHVTNPSAGNTYTIKATDRVRTAAQFYAQHDQELDIVAQNMQTGLLDNTMVAFDSRATDGFDPQFDADKFGGALNRHTLYSLNSNKWMSRNVLNSINTTGTVAVGFEPGATGSFVFSFNNVSTFDPTSYIFLEDLRLNSMHDVRSGNYTFTADSADEWNRFVLHFTPSAVIQTANATCSTSGMLSVIQPGAATWSYTVTDANNAQVASGTLSQSAPLNVKLGAGNYTLNLVDNNGYAVTKAITIGGSTDVTASFEAPATVQAQGSVAFVNTSVNAANLTWSISNGTTVTTLNTPAYTFTQAGSYTVMLTATSSSGCTATAQKVITVTEATAINNVTATGNITMWSYENRVFVDFTQVADVNATVKIYDMLGREISNGRFTTSVLYQKELNNMDAAYVIVSVVNNGNVETKKLFINNTK